MPVIFSGAGLGGITITDEYFILTIDSRTTFTISESIGGAAYTLTTRQWNDDRIR